MDELTRLSLREMARRVGAREVSPVELVEAHLKRIESLNPRLNALICLDRERIREQARAAEQVLGRGAAVGPLHGVPMTIKSSIDIAGLRCESGTQLRAGHVPATDAPLVARLRAAGALILGTTNVAEMLMAYESENPLYGRTNNPWDLDRTPGGSSGGEAAAIAAGLSAAGVGSDGGGSIRIPAHFSGICGLKPTPGRIPSTGHFPPSGGPFAFLGVVGPMARTVSDLRLLLEVMAGPDAGDPSAAPVQPSRLTREEARGIHVGYFVDEGCTPVTVETRAAVERAAQGLQQAGLHVVRFRPQGLERARELWNLFFAKCAELVLRPMMGDGVGALPILREYLDSSTNEPAPTMETLLQAWIERDQLRGQFLRQTESLPALLCPVSSIPAFRHGERAWKIEGQAVRYLDAMSYAQWFNLLGLPAAVVPVGQSPEGLPIGVQIVGRPYEEEVVLAIAERVEKQCGGWREPPLERSYVPG